MRWRELPVEARRYIIYHVIVCPLLFAWYMIPYYLLSLGYTVVETGLIFTVIQLIGVPLSYLMGKIFTYNDIRIGIASIDFLEGISRILLGLAYGPIAPIIILIALIFEDLSDYFYPVYLAYEKLIYPSDKMKDALA